MNKKRIRSYFETEMDYNPGHYVIIGFIAFLIVLFLGAAAACILKSKGLL